MPPFCCENEESILNLQCGNLNLFDWLAVKWLNPNIPKNKYLFFENLEFYFSGNLDILGTCRCFSNILTKNPKRHVILKYNSKNLT